MKNNRVSKYFLRDFFLGLPLLVEIIVAFVIDKTPWANYGAYLSPIIISTS